MSINTITGHLVRTTAAVVFACSALAPRAEANAGNSDVIIEWNELAQQFNRGQPFTQSRTYAMVHIAMADAVVAIEGRYKPYHARIRAPHRASTEAAAAQAAHDVLV